jgi:hypothetical protein
VADLIANWLARRAFELKQAGAPTIYTGHLTVALSTRVDRRGEKVASIVAAK